MLYDKDFLLKLDKSKNKTIYARITALKFDETPVEWIEGRVTQGSVNIDGASAVRRTCSLSMVAQDFDYHDYYWGLNSKFKLEVGVQNLIDSNMPDIIWFNQGIYLISSFNTSRSTSNFTISINGKDKMCLLNGEVGGSLESSVDFGTIQEEDKNGVWRIRKIPIQEIIRNLVHTYAGEPYWNIIINDLNTYGLELLEYRYDTPMYIYRDAPSAENGNVDSGIYHNIIMENPYVKVGLENGQAENTLLKDIPASHLDTLVDSFIGAETDPEYVYVGGKPYIFAKVEYGHTVGYRVTDLVYPGDLIAGVGESITSVLDKIKNMLTEFEYFYDLDGRFVFQKKKSFTSTMWSPLKQGDEGQDYIDTSLAESSSTAYTFSGSELITAFNNNPNLLNVRNDYSIWGERTGVSGAAIPIHMRYAIDKKPLSYQQIYFNESDRDYAENKYVVEQYNTRYGTTLTLRTQDEAKLFTAETSDWREVIYQMALDYYKYNMLDNFELLVARYNPEYPTGQTGYEKYYIDLQGFWRQLYNPETKIKLAETRNKLDAAIEYRDDKEDEIEAKEQSIKNLANQIAEGKENGNDVGELEKSMLQEQNNLSVLQTELRSAQIDVDNLIVKVDGYEKDLEEYYQTEDTEDTEYWYWSKNVFEHPELLNFWFDFLDVEGELQDYNVKNIGSRSKSINDTNVKSIYFRETPSVVFTADLNAENQLPGYRYIQIPEELMDEMFTISAQGKSAKNRLDELIYQHGYYTVSASITAIPIYYLEPNVRIYVYDKETGIDGEYVVSKITLPLAYNGTMSLTATKAAENVL